MNKSLSASLTVLMIMLPGGLALAGAEKCSFKLTNCVSPITDDERWFAGAFNVSDSIQFTPYDPEATDKPWHVVKLGCADEKCNTQIIRLNGKGRDTKSTVGWYNNACEDIWIADVSEDGKMQIQTTPACDGNY